MSSGSSTAVGCGDGLPNGDGGGVGTQVGGHTLLGVGGTKGVKTAVALGAGAGGKVAEAVGAEVDPLLFATLRPPGCGATDIEPVHAAVASMATAQTIPQTRTVIE